MQFDVRTPESDDVTARMTGFLDPKIWPDNEVKTEVTESVCEIVGDIPAGQPKPVWSSNIGMVRVFTEGTQRHHRPLFVIAFDSSGLPMKADFAKRFANKLHMYLRKDLYIIMPSNPAKNDITDKKYMWGMLYTHPPDNAGNRAFVNGDTAADPLFNEKLGEVATHLTQQYDTELTLAMGYSMGGFGTLQLAASGSCNLDYVLCAAGHGRGSTEPKDVDQKVTT